MKFNLTRIVLSVLWFIAQAAIVLFLSYEGAKLAVTLVNTANDLALMAGFALWVLSAFLLALWLIVALRGFIHSATTVWWSR